MMKKLICVLFTMCSWVQASCPIHFPAQQPTEQFQDPLALILSKTSTCPGSIQELNTLLKEQGLQQQINMVANRGRNNPVKGSFSFFSSITGQFTSGEIVHAGDFFLGYFTDQEKNILYLDQQPEKNKLLIEVIAWDSQQGQYHFYELKGLDELSTAWFYRGDSQDAFKDNVNLYRKGKAGESHFGNRMRCSACHNSGGPILKELAQPHNDWWQAQRPLILEPNQPDEEIISILAEIQDVSSLAQDVQKGMDKLRASSAMQQFQQQLSMQEQLRPLFCTTEINLQSSADIDEPISRGKSDFAMSQVVTVPSAFWINPLLGTVSIEIPIKKYQDLLQKFSMRFPETKLQDADHPWLTPVKGQSDLQAISALINHQTISRHFAEAVLMIDFAHPVFSAQRCELLHLVGNKENWYADFVEQLAKHPEMKAAQQLLLNLQKGSHEQWVNQLQEYKLSLMAAMQTLQGLEISFNHLIALRKEVLNSEISQNPRGQILEPGFRVIFPVSKI